MFCHDYYLYNVTLMWTLTFTACVQNIRHRYAHVLWVVHYIGEWMASMTRYYAAVLYSRITRLAHPSVRLSVQYGLELEKTKSRKVKICVHVFQDTSKWSENFQLKMSKVKVTRRQKPQEIAAYLADRAQRLRFRLQIVRQFTVNAWVARQLDGRSHIMSALGTDIFPCLMLMLC